MPFVAVHSTIPVSVEKRDLLQKEIGRIIALIPGKTIDNCMTKIMGEAPIFMSGEPAKAVFCEIRLYGAAPRDSKARVTAELHSLFETELGADKVYINFMESTDWGAGGSYRG